LPRRSGRTPADTKRQILDAATRVIRRNGLAASLDEIAAEAGVSKGGLLYHYKTKQALLIALGEQITQSFADLVEQNSDPDDRAPGALNRAYIKASFANLDAGTMRDNIALAAHLISDPELQPLAEADGTRWREQLLADGLPAPVVALIIAACDGVSTGPLWGSALEAKLLNELKEYLLGLTQQGT